MDGTVYQLECNVQVVSFAHVLIRSILFASRSFSPDFLSSRIQKIVCLKIHLNLIKKNRMKITTAGDSSFFLFRPLNQLASAGF